MNYYLLAHAGEEHATKTSSFSHFIKSDGVKIFAVCIVTTAVLYVALKILSRGNSYKNDDAKDT